MNTNQKINFPEFTGFRCLMMPFIQGDSDSLPEQYKGYSSIIDSTFLNKGDIGYLTIDELPVIKGVAHRAAKSKTNRAIHTEVGIRPNKIYAWGGGGWGRSHTVELDSDVKILLANNTDDSCAIWNRTHYDTSIDGDIGHYSELYPYSESEMMKAGEVHKIGILTPHESIPVKENTNRQFLRIVSSGVHGRESYFTENELMHY